MTLELITQSYALNGFIRLIDTSTWEAEEIFGSIHRSREATAHQLLLPTATEQAVFSDTELIHPALRPAQVDGPFPFSKTVTDRAIEGTQSKKQRQRATNSAFFERAEALKKLRKARAAAYYREYNASKRKSYMRRTLVAGLPYERYWYQAGGSGEQGARNKKAKYNKEKRREYYLTVEKPKRDAS